MLSYTAAQARALMAGATQADVLGAISDWREDHALLINTTESLPNWAFLIHRNKLPARGDYVFFDPPASELVRAHFGPKPQMFGKIVYGMPGVAQDIGAVTRQLTLTRIAPALIDRCRA